MAERIQSTSFSRLQVFEECPYRAYLAYVERVPELPRPTPPKGGEHANDRGSRVHDSCELYVRGEQEPIREMQAFMPEFTHLRDWFKKAPDQIEMEQLWCFDDEWNIVADDDWDNIWLRVKLDLKVMIAPDYALVVDYKTGKKYGNEVKHAQQNQLYIISTFMRYPEIELTKGEFWYLDQKDISNMELTRKQGLRFFKNFDTRLHAMTDCTNFKAKPNGHTCRFCPYSPQEYSNKWVNKNGACKFGVS